jgi:hypothetical protein
MGIMRMKLRLFILLGVVVLCCTTPVQGWGQYEVEQRSPLWLRGLLDVRIARGGRAPAWMDDGLGKSRYGGRGTSHGFERVTRIALSHLAIEFGAALPWNIEARTQLNWETDIDNDDRPLLIEAFLRKEWGTWSHGWGLQVGVMNPPLSLEHSGPAVTPLYTLTPSALSTWVWEEGRIVGAAVDWWRATSNGLRVNLLLGSGFGPDQTGRLLALRGWVLSDALAGVNSDAPLPMKKEQISVFDERDQRPSLYSLITISDERETFALRLGYFDTLGDQRTKGVWETRFGTAGVVLRPWGRLELLAQYMEGAALVRGSANDTGFSGFYTLASLGYRTHRISGRYDAFRTMDLDGAPFPRERGEGITLAYLFEYGLHHRVGFEYVFLQSRRPPLFRGDPSDGGWQLSYRFRY